jgi:hypothetical protein
MKLFQRDCSVVSSHFVRAATAERLRISRNSQPEPSVFLENTYLVTFQKHQNMAQDGLQAPKFQKKRVREAEHGAGSSRRALNGGRAAVRGAG